MERGSAWSRANDIVPVGVHPSGPSRNQSESQVVSQTDALFQRVVIRHEARTDDREGPVPCIRATSFDRGDFEGGERGCGLGKNPMRRDGCEYCNCKETHHILHPASSPLSNYGITQA